MIVVLSLCFFSFVLYKIFWSTRQPERASQNVQSTEGAINPSTGFPMQSGSAIDVAGHVIGEKPSHGTDLFNSDRDV